jgi:hypothetical protein
MTTRISRIQEIPSVVRNINDEKVRYPKKAYFFCKMFEKVLKLEKGDEIRSSITKIDKNEWKVEITGKVKKEQKFFLGA